MQISCTKLLILSGRCEVLTVKLSYCLQQKDHSYYTAYLDSSGDVHVVIKIMCIPYMSVCNDSECNKFRLSETASGAFSGTLY